MVAHSSKPAPCESVSPVNADDQPIIFPRRKAGQSKKNGSKAGVVVTLEILEQVFDMPLHRACKSLGVCATAFKKVCRKLGVMKWPYKDSHMPPKKESSRRRCPQPARVSARTNAERSSERLQVKHSLEKSMGSPALGAQPVASPRTVERRAASLKKEEREEKAFVAKPQPMAAVALQEQLPATRPPMYTLPAAAPWEDVWESSSPESTTEEEEEEANAMEEECVEQQPEWLDLACGMDEESDSFAASCLTTRDFESDLEGKAAALDGDLRAGGGLVVGKGDAKLAAGERLAEPSAVLIAGGVQDPMGFALNSETEDSEALELFGGMAGGGLWQSAHAPTMLDIFGAR